MSENKIISSIERSSTEQLQIAIKEYKGKRYLDLRIFYTTDNGGSWLPTKKGVTISPDQLLVLKDAVDLAINELDSCVNE